MTRDQLLEYLEHFTLVTDGKAAALERVAIRAQLPWVQIDCPEPLTVNLDGEPVASRHFRIECVPQRLRMHLPPGSPLLKQPFPSLQEKEKSHAAG